MRLSILLDNQLYRDIRKKQLQLNADQKNCFQELFRRHQSPNFLFPEFYHLIVLGVPSEYRSAVWCSLVPNIYNITDPLYNQILLQLSQHQILYPTFKQLQQAAPTSLNKQPSMFGEQWADQRSRVESRKTKKLVNALKNIENDLPRTFPQLTQFHNNPQWQTKLNRILGAFAIIRDDIGYIQGLSQITALLQLQLTNEIDIFISLITLLSATPLNDFYTFQLHTIDSICSNVELVVDRLAPELYEALQNHEIQPKLYVVNWIMTMFTRLFQFDTILMIWDIIFANNVSRRVLEELCGAIICGRRNAILGCQNPSKLIKLLLHSKLDIEQQDWVLQHMRSIPRTF